MVCPKFNPRPLRGFFMPAIFRDLWLLSLLSGNCLGIRSVITVAGNSPGTVGGMTEEFLIPVAQIIVPALSVAAVAWMNGHAGRKLRLKVGDIELEASTQEGIDALLTKALELKAAQSKQPE